ncbi:hypothetical protein IKE13_02630, partial [Candidatus Saccharibacteria bacterium]|nr:hypothetical protein [Candidatus Saccharibacteria bacterium]
IIDTGYGYWWSSIAGSTADRYGLYYNGSSLNTGSNYRYYGRYIRCVNDNSTSSKLYMQDQTQSSLATLMPNVGDEVTLYDSRDEKSYTVAKLADGNYWMAANLNLAGGTALSADDTDVDASYISSFTTSNNLTKSDNTIVLPASSQSFNTNNYSYVYNSSSTDCSSSTGCYGYYSWDAATLGSGRSISVANTNASYSICPKGWKLPTTYDGSGSAAEATDFRALMIALGGSNSVQTYNSSTTPTGATMYGKLVAAPYNFLLTGYYNGDSFYNGGSRGYYWSATSSSSTYARRLYFYSDFVYSASTDLRNYGFSVRCVFGD